MKKTIITKFSLAIAAIVFRPKNKIWIFVLFFYGCSNGQERFYISQCYSTDKLCVLIRQDVYNSERKSLFVFDGKDMIAGDIELKTASCEIEKVSHDTVFLTYVIFLQNPSDSPTIKASSLPLDHPPHSPVILLEKLVELNGNVLNRNINSDSINIQNQLFLPYSGKIERGKLDINHVIYDGRDFSLSIIENFGKAKTPVQSFIDITTNNPAKARTIYYDYVNSKIFDQVGDVINYYRKI